MPTYLPTKCLPLRPGVALPVWLTSGMGVARSVCVCVCSSVVLYDVLGLWLQLQATSPATFALVREEHADTSIQMYW